MHYFGSVELTQSMKAQTSYYCYILAELTGWEKQFGDIVHVPY